MRIALGIEYDGSHFCGWQRQESPELRTVQACLEQAVSTVADQQIQVVCAGRTDTGVHATDQVVHFDTEVQRSMRAWVFGSNANLPSDIVVRWAKIVPNDFHARFSALARRYCYYIYNSPVRPALLRNTASWNFRPLNIESMQEAAQYLIGEHDFTSYRALACQSKTAVRTIHHLTVTRQQNLVIIDIKANAFLHHMVRNIAGVLMTIGAGIKSPSWAQDVLMAKDRSIGGVTAPPNGLYLVNVEYPDIYNLPPSSSLPLIFL